MRGRDPNCRSLPRQRIIVSQAGHSLSSIVFCGCIDGPGLGIITQQDRENNSFLLLLLFTLLVGIAGSFCVIILQAMWWRDSVSVLHV